MDIRPFHESDGAEVIALCTEVFGYTAAHNRPEAVIRQKLAVQRELFLAARLDGRLAGTVLGGYDGHRGWVYSLAVRPDLRRRGIGTALMHQVERELARRGRPKINLQVLATNAATVAFSEKLGYSVEQRISMGKVLGRGAGGSAR